MFIKTVSTTSGINPIKFDETGGVFYWILNTGLSTVYASTKSAFTAGDDGVVSLGPKESRRLETNNDTIYILGEGQVEIHNQRDGICSFKQAPTSSGGGETIDAYSKTESDAKYAAKSDVPDAYTKTESDAKYAAKSDVPDAYTKTESDAKYASKALYGDTTINVGRKAGSAVGEKSTAEGLDTTASGNASHAEGSYTMASGFASHAEGSNTVTNNDAEHASGKFNVSNEDTLFSVGDGTDDNNRHNAFEITKTGGKLHDKDIAVDVANPNLLINPDFKINQRAVSGTFSDAGKYFVDRWKLDSGTVTVHTNGTLTLNGTMSQILENAAGTDVTASVSAGAAAYDDSTKTFSITGDGAVISWVKLERGGIATAFVPPDPAMEQMKCYRFFYRVGGKGIANPNDLSNSNRIAYHNGANFWVSAIFQFPVEMRVVPTAKITGTPWCFKELYSTKSDVAGEFNMDLGIGVVITAETSGYEIRMITDYLITLKTPDGYVGPSNSTGYTDFDAEIY